MGIIFVVGLNGKGVGVMSFKDVNLVYCLMLMNMIVEKLVDMVIWFDESGRYVFVNFVVIKFFGYFVEEFV